MQLKREYRKSKVTPRIHHGLNKTPEHKAWAAMMARGVWNLNPKTQTYKDYRAKGITVCERWRDFSDFLADMGLKPTSAHTLDRIDPAKDYEPGNCRWATRLEQNRNCPSRRVEFQGESLLLCEWAERIGITLESLYKRRKRMSLEEALSLPRVPVSERYKFWKSGKPHNAKVSSSTTTTTKAIGGHG